MDVAVVGAGVVGCAVAREAAARGLAVALLETEPGEGRGVTGRNSGVLHSGLYYAPGSRKARTCVRGQALAYEWAARFRVPHRRVGKLVVARTPGQDSELQALAANAQANGARDVTLVTAGEALAREPALAPTTPQGAVRAALWCPWSGVIDAHAFTHSLRLEAERMGALVALGARVHAAEATGRGAWRLDTARGPLVAQAVVNAAGLFADEVAGLLGVTGYEIHPARGDWFALTPRLARTRGPKVLLYPGRAPGGGGLGIHSNVDLAGAVRFGPDFQWVADKGDVTPAESKRAVFHGAAEALVGPLPADALTWDGAGLRPRLFDGRGAVPVEHQDFVFHLQTAPGRALHLLGTDSPGLTAALALAEEALDALLG